jgi:hypothetical protein
VALLTDDAGQPLRKPVRSPTGASYGRSVLGAAADSDLAMLFNPEELFAAGTE